ncbi:MAG: DUF4352 domain-containing protein [Chloroflexales bacterium]|nr:DUF4352 domain-containing protein [Chloroflexales bacterium]
MSIRNGMILLALLVGLGLQPATRTHADARCFSETNQCIDGRIREFWEQNGGLPVFGFPISGMENTTVEGKQIDLQRFERNRLELHPENAQPYDVLLGRLGADRLAQQGRDWFGFAKNGDTGGCRLFSETGHAVCGKILTAWRANGLKLDRNGAVSAAESLALFGLPLSDLQTETMSNGQQYQVQWFERARFELHPENSFPYNVLLGLLGNEVSATPTVAVIPPPKDPLYEPQTSGLIVSGSHRFKYVMTLNNFHYETTSKADYSKPRTGNQFLIFNMTITNLGPSTADATMYMFHVLDSNGRLLDYDYESRIRDCAIDSVTLLPGGTTSGCTLFEVPSSGRLEIVYAPYENNQFAPGRYLKWVIRP